VTRDLITGLVCLITSVVLFALTLGLPGPSLLVPIGPGFYPRVILGISGALSAALIVQALLARKRVKAAPEKKESDPNYRLVLASFAVFGIYVALLPFLGYRIATFAFVLACQPMLEAPRSAKGWMVAVIIAGVTSFVTFYVFQDYLSVLLPRGSWTGF
jgi:hypothetical protein